MFSSVCSLFPSFQMLFYVCLFGLRFKSGELKSRWAALSMWMGLVQVFVKIDVAGCFVGNPRCGNVGLLFWASWRVLKIASSLLPEGSGPAACIQGWSRDLDLQYMSIHLISLFSMRGTPLSTGPYCFPNTGSLLILFFSFFILQIIKPQLYQGLTGVK